MNQLTSNEFADVHLDDHGVATLCIVNAKSMNILGTLVIEALTTAVNAIAADPRVRVVVLRGSGDKAFVGGANIYEMAALNPDTAAAFITRLGGLCEAVRSLPMPTIARLSGYCLGGGLELALCCDLRLSSTHAYYGMPEVHVGIPSVIHAALMPRLIGASRAQWMLLTGDNIDAARAEQWGLVHSLHAPNELDAAIAAQAQRLAALGPAVLRQQKALLRAWEKQGIDEAIAATIPEFAKAFTAGEPAQYMAAFTQRKPNNTRQ